MNTPAHAVFNLLALSRRDRSALFAPIVVGAVLPDVPMLIFYLYEKVWLGTSEGTIWSESYDQLGWQAVFDLFNSIPLLAIGAVADCAMKRPRGVALLASMMVHSLSDLALHHHDAHRHLFPFSEWRFASPVSYWDPRHYGGVVSSLEVVLVVAGSLWLLRTHPKKSARLALVVGLASYLLYWGYAVVMWG